MSRIRTIKPELWTSEQVVSCSRDARLLFIGLWNFCDDNGIHPASYMRIKMEVFPGDSCSMRDIKSWISELIQNNLLREYAVDEQSYWIVTGWKKHQRIDRPSSKYPEPQSDVKKIKNSMSALRNIDDCSTTIPRIFDEHSTNTLGVVDESSVTESNGMESTGREIKNIGEVLQTSPVVVSKPKSSASTSSSNNYPNEVNCIFEHWKTVMKHPNAKLDEKRKRKIMQAMKLNFTTAELKQAIDGCSASSWNMGHNDRQQVYDGIELIFRDAEHIEKFIALTECSQNEMKSNSVFAGAI